MTPVINNWGPAVVVVLGYILGYYFQTKRFDSFEASIYKYIDAKFETVGVELKAIKDRLDKIEKRLDRLEETKLVR